VKLQRPDLNRDGLADILVLYTQGGKKVRLALSGRDAARLPAR
jgi:hypothetical protein